MCEIFSRKIRLKYDISRFFYGVFTGKKKKECQPPMIGTRFIRFRIPKNIEQINGNK